MVPNITSGKPGIWLLRNLNFRLKQPGGMIADLTIEVPIPADEKVSLPPELAHFEGVVLASQDDGPSGVFQLDPDQAGSLDLLSVVDGAGDEVIVAGVGARLRRLKVVAAGKTSRVVATVRVGLTSPTADGGMLLGMLGCDVAITFRPAQLPLDLTVPPAKPAVTVAEDDDPMADLPPEPDLDDELGELVDLHPVGGKVADQPKRAYRKRKGSDEVTSV